MRDAGEALFQRLIELPDTGARSRLLREEAGRLERDEVERLADLLRRHALDCFHKSPKLCGDFADLIIVLGDVAGAPLIHAAGTRLSAFVEMLRTNDNERALSRFDEAAAIYLKHDDPEGWAQVQTSRLVPLADMGRLDEALVDVGRASKILEECRNWRSLGTLLTNTAHRLSRAQRNPEALATIERALEAMHAAGAEGVIDVPNTQLTRSMILVNLGRSREAIDVLREALREAERLNQASVAAQITASLGRARYAVGLFARALADCESGRDLLEAAGAQHDASHTQLLISECLIHLKRFESAILHARGAYESLMAAGFASQAGQALLNEGRAMLALRRPDEALEVFGRAEAIFEDTGDSMWLAETRLQAARGIMSVGRTEEALAIARESAEVLNAAGAALECTQARLVAAAASHALGMSDEAARLADQVIEFAANEMIDHLAFEGLRLRADLAYDGGDRATALTHYLTAIEALERAQSQVVAEHRADFVSGREHAYERVVDIHLDAGDTARALAYVDRAKARALIALIEESGGLRASVQSAEDLRIGGEIDRLVVERARLIEAAVRAGAERDDRAVRRIESRIGALRDTRIVRRLEPADSADVWSVGSEMPAPEVPVSTVLLEYFSVGDGFVGFALTAEGPEAIRLEVGEAEVRRLLRALNLNFAAAPLADDSRLVDLIASADKILKRLYDGLIAPFADMLDGSSALFVVPHGSLHYVPFHALYDGRNYLAANHDVSYLPAAKYISAAARPKSSNGTGVKVLAVGNECGGRLPNAIQEAIDVAAMWNGAGTALLNSEATRASVQEQMTRAGLIHFATHGQYVAESPLFSSIELEDGDLTALDIFETRLEASLVTLSACESARSTIGGGDEIQGIIRAFLSAGARSIVASLWTIEDRCGSDFMRRFNAALRSGEPKSVALNSIYRDFIERKIDAGSENDAPRYVHPYYWAPYVLIGDPGKL